MCYALRLQLSAVPLWDGITHELGLMTARSLLGKALKSDEVIEFLEMHEVDVVYSFDRLHENSPDVYWASAKEAGLEFRFNEYQKLDTAYCYLVSRDDFSPAESEMIGVSIFDSFASAEQACQRDGLRYQSSATPGLWLKILGDSHDTHYEFTDDRLSMVALMVPWDDT